jgi:hypothetical protein
VLPDQISADRPARSRWPQPLGVVAGSAGFLLAVWGFSGPTAVAAAGSTVTISGSMEGNLPVNPGDTIKAGFHISIPGNKLTHDTTIDTSGGQVTMTANCSGGGTAPITVTLPDQSLTIPAGSTGWQPSGGQSDPSVWQGSTVLPGNFCGGKGAHVPGGATFTDTFTDSSGDTVGIAIQFHYADNTSGSWSGTAHTTVSPGPETPSKTSTTTSTTTAQTGAVQGISTSPTTSSSPATPVAGVQGVTSTPNTGTHLPLGLGLGLVASGLGLIGIPAVASRRRRR